MLKRIKHGTTIATQSMKKAKGPMHLDPEFEAAAAHVKEFRQAVVSFIDDAQAILALMPRISKTTTELSGLTTASFEASPPDDRDLADRFAQLTQTLQTFVGSRVTDTAGELIVQPLQELVARVDEVSGLKKEHRDNFLILESNKDKLDGLQKEPDKNAEKIQIYAAKVAARTKEVERLEAEFIGRVATLWENRYDVVAAPISRLLAIIFELAATASAGSQPLKAAVGQELLARSFPLPDAAKGRAKR
jgi:hypothetical protein